MKMVPAYPRDLKTRMKKREFSGKSCVLSDVTEKETEVTTKNNVNNINTHSV